MDGGGATLDRRGIMKRWEDEQRKRYELLIEELMEQDEDEGTKTMPPSQIIKYFDLVEKAWGWDKLLPYQGVSWSDYSKYLEEYYRRNSCQLFPGAAAATGSVVAALAETCLNKEEQLACEWKNRMNSEMDVILPSKKIILCCLIHESAHSVIRAAGSKFSDVSSAALLCIAKEADLTCELLRRGASPSDDYLIEQSSEIRMCALSLMNCTSCHSVAASAAMMGVSKEAETMYKWMRENEKLIDFFDDFIPLPKELLDSRKTRIRTLYAMIDILNNSSSAAASGSKVDKEESASRNGSGGFVNGINADEAATITGCCTSAVASGSKVDKEESASRNGSGGDVNVINADEATTITGCCTSNVLDSQYQQKITVVKFSGNFLEKGWGWERLLPLNSTVAWSDYSNYLMEYYNRNALKFIAEQSAIQNPEWLLDSDDRVAAAGIVKSCLKTEEELVSRWITVAPHSPDDILPCNTLIQSSLVKECALSISSDKLSVPSTIAFVCITKEADLMHELLKHGAKPTDDVILQSSVIRMCALGLVNLKGCQSIVSAAAMVGVAKAAKMMCDWMKSETKLLTFSMFEPPELMMAHFIRTTTLGVMINILQESTFPSYKIPDDAMTHDLKNDAMTNGLKK